VCPLTCSRTSRMFYVIKTVQPDKDISFHLVVDNATTALECYRRDWRTIPDVVKHLTEVGKPFRTFNSRARMFTGPTSIRHCSPLGWRRKDFVFRLDDYRHYEDVFLSFLQLSHAHASLQSGGILWRLSVDVIGTEIALQGPSADAHVFGDIVTAPNGDQFVSDRLTDEEMDLLCGKYYVYTGWSDIVLLRSPFLIALSGQGTQTSQKSWWPLQSTFLKSSLWIGYWTQQCEDWYQARKRSIYLGTAQPYTIAEWRRILRRCHDPPHISEYVETAAANYFNQHYSL